ncbi:MAG TPA: hypothetical protein VFI73_10960 [Candidatus Nitrosopolaris sp.]|nr:hypothetical protein [Candidatus Nitrosopolaris sp.]
MTEQSNDDFRILVRSFFLIKLLPNGSGRDTTDRLLNGTTIMY